MGVRLAVETLVNSVFINVQANMAAGAHWFCTIVSLYSVYFQQQNEL